MICFTDKEWQEYSEASDVSDIRLEAQACLDCTVQFQTESLERETCRPMNFGLTPLWRVE